VQTPECLQAQVGKGVGTGARLSFVVPIETLQLGNLSVTYLRHNVKLDYMCACLASA